MKPRIKTLWQKLTDGLTWKSVLLILLGAVTILIKLL